MLFIKCDRNLVAILNSKLISRVGGLPNIETCFLASIFVLNWVEYSKNGMKVFFWSIFSWLNWICGNIQLNHIFDLCSPEIRAIVEKKSQSSKLELFDVDWQILSSFNYSNQFDLQDSWRQFQFLFLNHSKCLI